jgi:hypothetical protein
MNKRFLVAWLIIFIAWMAGSFVVHGVLLAGDYMTVPSLFRPEAEAQQYFPLMIVAHVILAAAFVWIYSRGVEDAPWTGQGIRFGLAVALLTVVPTYIIYHVVQPMPGSIAVKQIVFAGILLLVLGLLVAFLYRDARRNQRLSDRVS